MARLILHLDLDAFYCAVEAQRDTTLQGRPFAVGGRPDQRGVVASCSYEARKFGVHSAMPMSQALRLCSSLVVVHPNFAIYRRKSQAVMAILYDTTPLVEQISIDEAFLDVTGLKGTGREIAARLQGRIHVELDLPCSFGVASNKLVAKIANNIGKATAQTDGAPNAILDVPPGEEAAFLAPLPIRELWGVGPKTAQHLNQLDIHTIGDLARWPERDLERRFGKLGADIAKRARGIDNRPVETEHEAKSISKETTFSRDMRELDTLRQTVRRLAAGVGLQLRRNELMGTTVKLKLRWSDFSTVTRQMTLPQPIDQDREIAEAALQLLVEVWTVQRPVRLIGVGISGLEAVPRQLELWESEQSKQERRLQSTLDNLRDRFGDESIKRGSDL